VERMRNQGSSCRSSLARGLRPSLPSLTIRPMIGPRALVISADRPHDGPPHAPHQVEAIQLRLTPLRLQHS
jgi:hypothetical protein